MKTLETQQLNDLLNWRYAVKTFDPNRKVDPIALDAILDAFRLAPSSTNVQPRGCVVVTDHNTRVKLKGHAFNQSQITDASHLLVLGRKTVLDESWIDHVIENIAMHQGVQPSDLHGLKQMQMQVIEGQGDMLTKWASEQVHIAAGFVLSACAALGVDACPMGGFDPNAFDEVLNLDDHNLASEVIIAIGYRSLDDQYATMPKARLPKEEVIISV